MHKSNVLKYSSHKFLWYFFNLTSSSLSVLLKLGFHFQSNLYFLLFFVVLNQILEQKFIYSCEVTGQFSVLIQQSASHLHFLVFVFSFLLCTWSSYTISLYIFSLFVFTVFELKFQCWMNTTALGNFLNHVFCKFMFLSIFSVAKF